MAILADIHFSPLLPIDIFDFANAELRNQWINEKGMVVFQLIDCVQIDRQIDVFVDAPVPFDLLYQGRENVDLSGTNAPNLPFEALSPWEKADYLALRVLR